MFYIRIFQKFSFQEEPCCHRDDCLFAEPILEAEKEKLEPEDAENPSVNDEGFLEEQVKQHDKSSVEKVGLAIKKTAKAVVHNFAECAHKTME